MRKRKRFLAKMIRLRLSRTDCSLKGCPSKGRTTREIIGLNSQESCRISLSAGST